MAILRQFSDIVAFFNDHIAKKELTGITFEQGKAPSSYKIKRSADIVSFMCYWSALEKSTSWVVIGSVPSGLRPPVDIYCVDNTNPSYGGLFYISATGNIGVRANSALNNGSSLVVSYCL